MPTTNSSSVTCTIKGEKKELKPRLAALVALNALHSGFNGSIRRLQAADFDAIVDVITIGLGKTDPEEPRRMLPDERAKVEADVYDTGFASLIDPCVDFLWLMARGGKPAPKPNGAQPEEDASKNK